MPRSPSAFIAHGSPMVALEQDAYHQGIRSFFSRFCKVGEAGDWPVRALLVISAHWRSRRGLAVTTRDPQHAVYDFMGFPRALYELKYTPAGAPAIAAEVTQKLTEAGFLCTPDANQGLDHGAWVPLLIGRPQADLPVLQLTLPFPAEPEDVFRLGQALAPLRDAGIAIIGSGDLVHNLGEVSWDEPRGATPSWCTEFESFLTENIDRGDFAAALKYEQHPLGERAHPSADHLFPLWVVLGAAAGAGVRVGAKPNYIFRGFHYGTVSMTSFWFA